MAVPTPVSRAQLSQILGAPVPGLVLHTHQPMTDTPLAGNPALTALLWVGRVAELKVNLPHATAGNYVEVIETDGITALVEDLDRTRFQVALGDLELTEEED